MTLSGRPATAILVALVLSVCLNVFVAGVVIGRVSAGGRPPLAQGGGGGFERFIATVPEEARPVVRQTLREHRPRIQERFLALRNARQDVAAIVGAEPFDRPAFEAAMATVRTRSKEMEAEMHGVIAEALAQLPAELRAQMAERWGEQR